MQNLLFNIVIPLHAGYIKQICWCSSCFLYCLSTRCEKGVVTRPCPPATPASSLNVLTDEVRSLKATVATLQTAVSIPHHCKQGDKEAKNGMSWSTVVKKGRGGRQQAPRINPSNGRQQENHTGSSGGTKPDRPTPTRSKLKVAGVRRIWGTLKTSPTSAIASALKKFTTVGSKLTVKRKFKTNEAGKVKWWFLVKGVEDDLSKLEGEWQQVKVQTAWRLETCYLPALMEGDTAAEGPAQDSQIASKQMLLLLWW